MSTQIKIWLSLLLAGLFAFTGYTLFKVYRVRRNDNPARTSARSNAADSVDLSEIKMTERSGTSIALGSLKGRVWVASTFFSSCPHECRAMNQTIAALHHDPNLSDVVFVSISVDPTIDTPEDLREYAKLFKADEKRWLFLTGQMADVRKLGRKLGITARTKTHTARLIALDAAGNVRGHFTYNNAAEMRKLKELLAELIEEGREKKE